MKQSDRDKAAAQLAAAKKQREATAQRKNAKFRGEIGPAATRFMDGLKRKKAK
jgi:hypothetical protein